MTIILLIARIFILFFSKRKDNVFHVNGYREIFPKQYRTVTAGFNWKNTSFYMENFKISAAAAAAAAGAVSASYLIYKHVPVSIQLNMQSGSTLIYGVALF